MKKYITPETTVINIRVENNILASSAYADDDAHRCDKDCKIYHICQDRLLWHYCLDKQTK